MFDEVLNAGGLVPGAAEEAAGTGEQAQPETTGDTLTLAQVQQMLKERDQQWERRFQSQMDKREASIVKRLREQGATAKTLAEKAKAQGMPPEQAAALQSALERDALNEILQDEEKRQAEAAKQAEQFDPDRVQARADELAARYTLSADDPEAKLIKVNGSLDEYYESIIEAGLMKRQRLAQSNNPAPGREGMRSPGAVPSGRGAPKTAYGMSKSDMLQAEIDNAKVR